MTISFKVTPADADLIGECVTRARALYVAHGHEVDKLSLTMDITAAHANGYPLRLADLLAADDFNFLHDVGGIMQHMDRETGLLLDHFSPRFSARLAA